MPSLTPPFGYHEVMPLEREHRIRLPAPGECPDFCRAVNALPLGFIEFPRALFHYPIAFVADPDSGRFTPVAVLGLEAGRNLFVDDAGCWAAGCYVPAYARRYPFCTAPVRTDEETASSRVVCVERRQIDAGAGEPLFDAAGVALPRWCEQELLLREYDLDWVRTGEFCDRLKELRLLTPFVAQAVSAQGGPWHLDGLYRVDEHKLEFLGRQYKTLARTGAMGRIYTHLLSLDNFGRLLDRQAALDQS